METKIKILYITNVPSPYRIDYFEELGRQCDLTVLFEKSTSDERDDSWNKYEFINFRGIILNGIRISTDSAFCPQVIKYIKNEKYDCIVVTDFLLPTGMLAIEYMRFKGIKYILESDGGFAKEKNNIRESVKTFFIKGASGYFSTCDNHDQYYIRYGANPHKIIRYSFTSVSKNEMVESADIDQAKKDYNKRVLSIKEKKMLLFVGQFITRKGIDVLLKSVKELDSSIGLYVIGGEPTEEYKEYVQINKLRNVHFIEFKEKEILNKYYMAADVFVFPTREDIWGLVVNEAMSKGLPVITTNKCNAGLKLVSNGENGYIVDVNNVNSLVKAIQSTLENSLEMGKKSLEIISNYTLENMAYEHLRFFENYKSI